jgi:hypothetical protein
MRAVQGAPALRNLQLSRSAPGGTIRPLDIIGNSVYLVYAELRQVEDRPRDFLAATGLTLEEFVSAPKRWVS